MNRKNANQTEILILLENKSLKNLNHQHIPKMKNGSRKIDIIFLKKNFTKIQIQMILDFEN